MSEIDEPGYTVGYKRPPEHTRFKPGQSGNLKGRPRGLDEEAIFNKLMKERIPIGQTGGKVVLMEALLRRLFFQAIKGDPRSLRMSLEEIRRYQSRSKDDGNSVVDLLQAMYEHRLAEDARSRHVRGASDEDLA
jgi:hypothetical protein